MLFLRYYFWIAPHLLLSVVLIGLLRRRLQKELTVFFAYVVFELLRFLLLMVIDLFPGFSRLQYRWVLVFGLGINTLLRFGVVYEMTLEVLRSHSTLAAVLLPLLRWTAAALLLLAAFGSATFSGGIQHVEGIFRVLDFSSNVVQSGLLVVLFLFSRVLHVSWRSCAAGIILGFGFFSSVELATSALRPEFADSGNIAIDLIQMAAYHVCVLVWLIYLFLPERSLRFIGSGLEKSDIEFWDQELQRMVRR